MFVAFNVKLHHSDLAIEEATWSILAVVTDMFPPPRCEVAQDLCQRHDRVVQFSHAHYLQHSCACESAARKSSFRQALSCNSSPYLGCISKPVTEHPIAKSARKETNVRSNIKSICTV